VTEQQKTLGRLEWLALSALGLAALMMFGADQLQLPLMDPGIFMAGVAFLLAGVHSCRYRVHVTGSQSRLISYSGLSAWGWGMGFSLIGLGVMLVGLTRTLGVDGQLWTLLARRLELPSGYAGLLLISLGIGLSGHWLRFDHVRAQPMTLLPARLAGGFFVLLGLALLAAALFEFIFPGTFGQLWNSFLARLPAPPAALR